MIKTLAKSIKEYKKVTILTPILVSIESVIDVLIPFLMAFLIDEGINQGNKEKIIFYGILLLTCAFLAMFFPFGIDRVSCYSFVLPFGF